MSLLLPNPSRPSYAQGFARNAAESENPGLWTGLRGLWMPSLGPTGGTLRDWERWRKHGTLTNMDPASDWVASPYGWALDFDGSNDSIEMGDDFPLDTSAVSMALCARISSAEAWGGIFGKLHTGGVRDWGIESYGDDPTRLLMSRNNAYFDVSLLPTSDWFNFVASASDSESHAYCNGASVYSGGGVGSGTTNNSTGCHLQLMAKSGVNAGGQVAMAAVWNRLLTSSEASLLHADPYALVRPRRRVFAAATAEPTGNPWYYYQHLSLGAGA